MNLVTDDRRAQSGLHRLNCSDVSPTGPHFRRPTDLVAIAVLPFVSGRQLMETVAPKLALQTSSSDPEFGALAR